MWLGLSCIGFFQFKRIPYWTHSMIFHTLKDKCIINRLSKLAVSEGLLVDIIAVSNRSHISMNFA